MDESAEWIEIDPLYIRNNTYLREHVIDMSTYQTGEFYSIYISVDNSVGTAESDTNVFLLADLPGKPNIPTRTSDGKQLTIAMTAPASDGGSQITSY